VILPTESSGKMVKGWARYGLVASAKHIIVPCSIVARRCFKALKNAHAYTGFVREKNRQ